MKRGPKAVLPATKVERGTYDTHRDGAKFMLTPQAPAPQRPDTLTTGGLEVWLEVSPFIAATKLATDADAGQLASYCNLLAVINATFLAGGCPPSAFLTESRRQAETWGLCGERSRIGVKPPEMQNRASVFRPPVIPPPGGRK